jgi:hypothetical protein
MIADHTGRTLAGRYLLTRPLGEGGAATVYEALDTQLQRRVAVKMLRPEVARDPRAAQRFQREAELSAGLSHPNLAQVYDAGAIDGLPYIVMERVAGEPIAVGQPVDTAPALAAAAQVASALAFVHAHDLLHGDVKPANVIVTPEGQAKLVDFGAADPVGVVAGLGDEGTTQRLPSAHASPDALPYMAPERLVGAASSPAADVYGLGATLYALLTGRPPYLGATPDALTRAQRAGEAPPVSRLNPAAPPSVDALVARAIARDPAARFQSAGEMQAALAAVLAGSRQMTAAMATPVAPAASAPTAANAAPVRPYVPAEPPGSVEGSPAVPIVAPAVAASGGGRGTPRWAPAALVGLLLLALLGLAALTLTHGQGRTEAAAPPTAARGAETPAPAAESVPQLLGLTVDQARAVAQQGGWTLVEAPAVANAAVAPGLITAQQPEQGIALEAGAPITVTTSAGAPTAIPAPPLPTATTAPPAPAPVAPAPPPQPKPGDKGPDKGKGKGNDKGGH